MALRVREDWATIRTGVRLLLRETDAASSYWSDATLLMLFNDALDQRALEMIEEDEGWSVDEFTADLVAGQREYALPEGGDRVRRVWFIYDHGGMRDEYEIRRDERPFDGMSHGNSGYSVTGGFYRPTFRIQGDLLILEPRPDSSATAALRVEYEGLQGKIVGDAGKIPLRYPVATETLLKYDTAIKARALENNADKPDADFITGLTVERSLIEAAWKQFIKKRTTSVIFSRPMDLGD
jgi:hypothetical protein